MFGIRMNVRITKTPKYMELEVVWRLREEFFKRIKELKNG